MLCSSGLLGRGAKEGGRCELSLPCPRLSSPPFDITLLLPQVRTLTGYLVAQGVENGASPEGLRTPHGEAGMSLGTPVERKRQGCYQDADQWPGPCREPRGCAAQLSPSCLLPPVYAQSSSPPWAHLASPSFVSNGSSLWGERGPLGPSTVLSRCLRGGNKPGCIFKRGSRELQQPLSLSPHTTVGVGTMSPGGLGWGEALPQGTFTRMDT